MFPFTVVVTTLLAAFASAQSFSSLPQCAQNCTINAIPNSCNLSPKCICSDAGFINAITCCVAKVCNKADQEATIKYADSICVPAGVTNLPTAAVCASATGTAANASTATGSAASSTSSVMSSAMSAASSAMSSASSAASSAQSVASSSVTSSAAIASSTGDASRAFYAQGLGMIGAAVGAAVALM